MKWIVFLWEAEEEMLEAARYYESHFPLKLHFDPQPAISASLMSLKESL